MPLLHGALLHGAPTSQPWSYVCGPAVPCVWVYGLRSTLCGIGYAVRGGIRLASDEARSETLEMRRAAGEQRTHATGKD